MWSACPNRTLGAVHSPKHRLNEPQFSWDWTIIFHNISYANGGTRKQDTRLRKVPRLRDIKARRPPPSIMSLPQKTRCPVTSKVRKLEPHTAPARLDTPTDLSDDAVRKVSAALNALLADTFALYVKTKNFHWHVSGPHFRDYHLLLDEQ